MICTEFDLAIFRSWQIATGGGTYLARSLT